jgi:uncharacterized protein (TIGR02217 family)
MSNAIFPTLIGLNWSYTFTPRFSTRIQTSVSGKEYRSQMMAAPLYDISLGYDVIKHGVSPDLRTIFGFFLTRQGSFDSFLYDNPDDRSVTDQLFAVGDGSNRNFQLARSFGDVFIEPVQNVNALTNVKANGVVQTLGSGYSVSSTGLVTFATAPSNGQNLTWSGTYYYRCRFTKDDLAFDKFMKDFWALKKLEMMGCLGTKI